MRAIIDDIFRQEMGHAPLGVTKLTGGLVNAVYALNSPEGDFIIRLKDDYFPVYRKEKYVMEQAATVGVPVPKVHAVGEYETKGYMITDKIAGCTGSDYTGDPLSLCREMGRLARLVNSIPVEGFGYHLDFDPKPHFRQSWNDVLAWDHKFIFADNALVKLDVISPDEQKRAVAFIEPMRNWQYSSFLSHNDLGLDNVMIDGQGTVHLIDWTLAQGLPAPYSDLGAFAAWTRKSDHVEAFMGGYGLSGAEWITIKNDVNRVAFLTILRATVWAKKEAPQKLSVFKNRVRNMVTEFLTETPDRSFIPEPG